MEAEHPTEKISALECEISQAKENALYVREELLKHYLISYILFANLTEEEKEISPIKEELLRLSILLEKVQNMNRKLERGNTRRVITKEMEKGIKKIKRSAESNPRIKYKKNAERLLERTAIKEDYNINAGKTSKKSKHNSYKE